MSECESVGREVEEEEEEKKKKRRRRVEEEEEEEEEEDLFRNIFPNFFEENIFEGPSLCVASRESVWACFWLVFFFVKNG